MPLEATTSQLVRRIVSRHQSIVSHPCIAYFADIFMHHTHYITRLGWAALVCTLFSQCATYHSYPHSGDPGTQSPLTGMNWRLPGIMYPESFFDVWATERSLFYYGPVRREPGISPITQFGVLPLQGDKYLDETEVFVGAYREFLYHLSRDSADMERYLPQLPVEVDSLYQTNPPFFFHPVVGVSRMQAEAYCAWRGQKINEQIQSMTEMGDSRWVDENGLMQVRMRLPTEDEWELAAGAGLDTAKYPYGYSTLLQHVAFDDEDVAYLHDRYWFGRSVAQVRGELEAFEATNHRLPVFNVFWPYAPEILQLPVPAYVYSFQPNDLGFYHMIGNVREWVADQPYSKGGSFLDPLVNISLQKGFEDPDGSYYLVGFRCLCELGQVPTQEAITGR